MNRGQKSYLNIAKFPMTACKFNDTIISRKVLFWGKESGKH